MEKVEWAYKEHFIIKKLYELDSVRIFAIEGLEHNWDLIHKFNAKDYIFVTLGFNAEEGNFKLSANVLNYLNPQINPKNFCFLCNTESQYVWARESGFNSILFKNPNIINSDGDI